MITVTPTPRRVGVLIYGDLEDLHSLDDAIGNVLGDEASPGSEYEMPALQILAISYELRQAWLGQRQATFVGNGMSPAVQQALKKIGPAHNVYFQIRIAIPEILFDVMALGDFIEIHSRKARLPALDRDILIVQLFQAEVTAALQSLLFPAAAARLAELIYGTVPRFRNYYTHYVEMLNGRFMQLTPEKRVQQILPLARRISERGSDYLRFARNLEESAEELDCLPEDLETVSGSTALSAEEW
ncbi:MAG TPA: hypothetical protein DD640_10005 [Clostridiales bacterium]|nr:hypothetical protein [Clostridiales bacterium]